MRGVDHQQSQSHWADDAIRSELELQMILSDKCRNRRLHSEPHGKCQTSENEDSCHKRADDSPARCSPRHFAKFIHCEHLAGVIGMFSLDTVLESRYVVRKTGGSVAVHFISTLATSERTW